MAAGQLASPRIAMIAITAATGQLGRLVVKCLLTRTDARQITAVVRNPAKAADLAGTGSASPLGGVR